ncbi:MAG: hypothetical protein AB7S71_24775 [Dongiaceae bacterium]
MSRLSFSRRDTFRILAGAAFVSVAEGSTFASSVYPQSGRYFNFCHLVPELSIQQAPAERSIYEIERHANWRLSLTSRSRHPCFAWSAIEIPPASLATDDKALSEALVLAAGMYDLRGAFIEGSKSVTISLAKAKAILNTLEQHKIFLVVECKRRSNESEIFYDPDAIDNILLSHPKLSVVLLRGARPYYTEAVHLATKHPGLHICPELMFRENGWLRFELAIHDLPDQFVFGMPFGSPTEIATDLNRNIAHKQYEALDLEKYLFLNSLRLVQSR